MTLFVAGYENYWSFLLSLASLPRKDTSQNDFKIFTLIYLIKSCGLCISFTGMQQIVHVRISLALSYLSTVLPTTKPTWKSNKWKEYGFVICSKQDSGEISNEFKLGTGLFIVYLLSFQITKIVPSLYIN